MSLPSRPLPDSRCCVFSTANDAYVPKAVVALLSFARHNRQYDMFLLCGRLSDENRQLCSDCRVTPIELDLGDAFYQEWKYPRECYYHFRGPELLLARGYDYSVYIDGDTYCNGTLRVDANEPFHLAGVSYDTVGAFFAEIGEREKLRDTFQVPGFDRPRLQSGVLLHNNAALAEAGYFKLAASLFDRSIKADLPRKGDDSLLALLLGMHPELRTLELPRSCNLIDFKIAEAASAAADFDADTITNCVIYHFVNDKPWFDWSTSQTYAHKYFADRWLEVMINHFSQEQIQRCFPAYFKESVPDAADVKFYWYDVNPNFGDWITPYIVQKVTGRPTGRSVDPAKTDKNVIISTGSVMRLSGPNTIVWGSGVRDRKQEIKPAKLVRSVRGPITRQRLLEVGGECPPIYGDPGLLLPRFYQPAPRPKKHKLGITPHVDQYNEVAALYADEADVAVLDLRTKNVERIIDRMHDCEAIASSSLHGIITAHAYGIPVRWIRFDDNIFGDDTKYADHFAAVGRAGEGFIDAVRYRKVPAAEILEQMLPPGISIDLERLWEAGVFHDGEISKYIRYAVTG